MLGPYIHKKAKKLRKVIMRRWRQAKKSKTRNRQWKTRPISVYECL